MARTFFYIGLPKTATTWLQEEVLPSIEGVEVRVPANWEEIDLRTSGERDLIVCARWMSASVSDRKRPGFGSWVLTKSLDYIRTHAPEAGIIIGFREQASWLRAGLSQKAKRRKDLDAGRYAASFGSEDLSWCWKLDRVQSSRRPVFPFLFEEIVESPESLVNDLCDFLGKRPPENLKLLVQMQRNPSPRSRLGLNFARSLSKLSASRRWREASFRLGTWADRFFPASRMSLEPELSAALREDWNHLVDLAGKIRERDLSRFGHRDRVMANPADPLQR